MTALLERMQLITDHILNADLVYGDEYDLQAGIGAALEQSNDITTVREHQLTDRDRLDFLVLTDDQAIALEVKVQGSRADVLRQLTRYAKNPTIDALMLVTTRAAHHNIPLELNSKPLRLVTLIGAGL